MMAEFEYEQKPASRLRFNDPERETFWMWAMYRHWFPRHYWWSVVSN